MKLRRRTKLKTKPVLLVGAVAALTLSAIIFVLAFVFGIFGNPETSAANPWDDYTYGKHLVVQASKVAGSGSHTDFPILLSFTDPDLRTTANGGELLNANGYDITFTTSDCNTTLDFDIEKYDATTGEILVWVKIPNLSATSNTGIHMYYSRSGVSVDPSSNAVWSSYDAAVFHLDGNVNDASGNGNGGTNTGAGSATGIIDGCYDYDGTNDYAITGSNELATANEFSVSVWFKADATNFAHHIWWQGQTGGNGWGNTHQEMHLSLGDWTTAYNPDVLHFFMGDIGIDITNDIIHIRSAFTDTTNWHNAVVNVKDLSTKPYAELYLDGTFLGADTGTTAKTNRSSWTNNFKIASPYASSRRFDGKVDELRVATGAKSADWIKTVYDMVTAPASFITKSSQMTGDDLCRTLPIQLTGFFLTNDDSKIEIKWQTASEINTDYFVIERSTNGENWIEIAEETAAGNSGNVIDYSVYDFDPENGINYYRLKEIDFDGSTIYFDAHAIEFKKEEKKLKFYPNPVSENLNIELSSGAYDRVEIMSIDGKILFNNAIDPYNRQDLLQVDFSGFPTGAYFVRLSGNGEQHVERIIKQIR